LVLIKTYIFDEVFNDHDFKFFHVFSRKYNTENNRVIAEFIVDKISQEYSNFEYNSLTFDVMSIRNQDVTDIFIESGNNLKIMFIEDIFSHIRETYK